MTLKSLLVLFVVFLSFKAMGQEDDELVAKKANYKINNKYRAGSNLIFNCDQGYYVCVDNDGLNLCKEGRRSAIERKLEFYPCAPLESFSSPEKCAQKNYAVIESVTKKRFCYPKN